jgi:hypothetical protein
MAQGRYRNLPGGEGKKQGSPGRANLPPGNTERTPGNTERTPGNTERAPGNTERTPGNTERTPAFPTFHSGTRPAGYGNAGEGAGARGPIREALYRGRLKEGG